MKGATEIDPMTAVKCGLFVQEVYDMCYADPDNPNPPKTGNFPKGYDLFETIQMKGPMSPPDEKKGLLKTRFMGLFARSEANRNVYVAAMRGTDPNSYTDLWVDAHCGLVPFSDNKPAEKVPWGVRDFYRTLTVMQPGQQTARPLGDTLSRLAATPANFNMVAAGHSLGAWLVTLLTFELANIGQYNPTIYTFGSPMAGNKDFVAAFNAVVRTSYRIINKLDPAQYYPPLDGYQHVKGESQIEFQKVPKEAGCYHYLNSYLFILSKGGVPLSKNCG